MPACRSHSWGHAAAAHLRPRLAALALACLYAAIAVSALGSSGLLWGGILIGGALVTAALVRSRRRPDRTRPLTRPAARAPQPWVQLLARLRSLLRKLIDQQNRAVPAEEVDQYLDALEEPKRTTLARLRQTILDILPEADQGVSYGVPAFKVRGKTIAGFAAFKNHLTYLPTAARSFRNSKMSSPSTQPRQGPCVSASTSHFRCHWSRS